MRESTLFFLVLLFAVQFTSSSNARAVPADTPEAVIEITKRDLGEVFAGEEIEHTFIVRNAGTKPLELKEKSAISSRSRRPEYAPSTAMWRTGYRSFIPVAAATPAAPS